MKTRGPITIYHKTLNVLTRLEEYTTYNYADCWYFVNEDSVINKGLTDSNIIDIRIPYETNENADIDHFSKGDIIYIGNGPETINSETELGEHYKITLLNNNDFGNNQHIHIGGK